MGKKRLEDAVQKFDHPVEVTYRCFELDPTAERDIQGDYYEKIANKYGMSLEQAKANAQRVQQMAASVGLDFQFEKIKLTNTFDAHRLAMYAKRQGMMKEMTERLLRAYYTESKHIGDKGTLVELAAEVGLEREAASAMLSSDDMGEVVRADEQEASELGISSIPFFLINRKYAITGAQSEEMFLTTFQQILEQDGPFNVDAQEGAACDENGCEIPVNKKSPPRG
ncbi:DsbA family oxidoreductase [Ammoniphilus sp. 3BR4]|uniref:DsbA family oxidoreductase n=1 Tax=Ammoniphilus sp. 3BR4 TaxID=3158265 RepID=UPI003467D5E4